VDTRDPRNRPVILRTAEAQQSARQWRPRPRTVLGVSAAALLTAVGVLAGSWSVWSVVGPAEPSGNPAPPLWFSPPGLEVSVHASSTVDSSTSGSPVVQSADANPHQTGSAPTTADDHSGRGRGGGNSGSGGSSGSGSSGEGEHGGSSGGSHG
jgi:hypothetical protein